MSESTTTSSEDDFPDIDEFRVMVARLWEQSTKRFKVTIPFPPRQSERPRVHRGNIHPYTPGPMRKYKREARVVLEAAMKEQGLTVFEGPVAIRADFYVKRPLSGPNRKARFCMTMPDIDNYEKMIHDCGGGNPAKRVLPVVMRDDKLIVDSQTTKQYADDRDPCTVYEVRELSLDRPLFGGAASNPRRRKRLDGD